MAEDPARPLGPGSTFAGCRIDSVAGRGGMGVVFKATQTALQRTVALKAIAPDLAEDASFRERFQREAHIAASIEHPNVIPVYEAGERDKTLYLMMRWVDGTDLRALLAAEGPLAPDRAVRLLRPVASALAAAHRRGLVHRDVKPANVLIARGDGDEHVYLTDFGIARHTKGASLTRTGVFVGTVDYTAPERIEGGKGDAASDIYSFGCMLFEALTGHVPFDRPTEVVTMFAHVNDPVPHAADEVPGIPKRLDAVIACAMAKNPADRFHSASELASALDRALEDDDRAPVEAREPATESEQPTVAAAGPPLARDEQETATLMQTPATRHVEDRAATTAAHSGRRPSRLLIVGALIVVAAIVAIVIVVASNGGGGGSPAPKASSTPFARKLSGDASVTVGSPITLPFAPTAVAAQGNGVWVAGSDKVALVAPGGIQRTLPITGTPKGIALDPKGNVWVSGANGNTVTILQQHKDIPTGPEPGAITITNHAAWVLTAGADAATRIDLITDVPESKPLPSPPVAVGQAYGRVWIACKDGSVRVFGMGGRPDPVAAPSIRDAVGIAPAFGVWFLNSSGGLTRVNPQQSAEVLVDGAPQYREYLNQGEAGSDGVGLGSQGETSDGIWALSHGDRMLSEIGSHDPNTAKTIAQIKFGADPGQLAVGAGVVWVTLPSAKLLYPVTTG